MCAYICVHSCVHVHSPCVHMYAHKCLPIVYRVYMYMYIHPYIHMCAHMCVYVVCVNVITDEEIMRGTHSRVVLGRVIIT